MQLELKIVKERLYMKLLIDIFLQRLKNKD